MTQHSKALLRAVNSLIKTDSHRGVNDCIDILAPHKKESKCLADCLQLLESVEILMNNNVLMPELLATIQGLINDWLD